MDLHNAFKTMWILKLSVIIEKKTEVVMIDTQGGKNTHTHTFLHNGSVPAYSCQYFPF